MSSASVEISRSRVLDERRGPAPFTLTSLTQMVSRHTAPRPREDHAAVVHAVAAHRVARAVAAAHAERRPGRTGRRAALPAFYLWLLAQVTTAARTNSTCVEAGGGRHLAMREGWWDRCAGLWGG